MRTEASHNYEALLNCKINLPEGMADDVELFEAQIMFVEQKLDEMWCVSCYVVKSISCSDVIESARTTRPIDHDAIEIPEVQVFLDYCCVNKRCLVAVPPMNGQSRWMSSVETWSLEGGFVHCDLLATSHASSEQEELHVLFGHKKWLRCCYVGVEVDQMHVAIGVGDKLPAIVCLTR